MMDGNLNQEAEQPDEPANSDTELPFLMVDISDALSEKDKIKFTVHMKTNLPGFTQGEVSVIREHEEFIWLYDAFDENPIYAGYIIPPPPPRPDFDTSREKLQKLSEGETTMTRDEFAKMKAELEAEYLATFKKTVAMHELFLTRLACHPVFRNDSNFRIFLEYQDSAGLSIRGKNKKEMLESIWKRFSQSADEVLLSGQKYFVNAAEAFITNLTQTTKNDHGLHTELAISQAFLLDTEEEKSDAPFLQRQWECFSLVILKSHVILLDGLSWSEAMDEDTKVIFGNGTDPLSTFTNRKRIKGPVPKSPKVLESEDRDPFFEHEKNYLVEYYGHLREAVGKSDKMTKALKNLCDVYVKIDSSLETLGSLEKSPELSNNLLKISDTYEKIRKLESRVASDYDLKLSDTFRYTVRDTQAAKDLLYRRLRCLANLETAGRNLERARMKNREIPKAEADRLQADKEFDEISEKAKEELQEFKGRRVATFKRNLIDLAELQLKHAKTQVHILKSTIMALKDAPA